MNPSQAFFTWQEGLIIIMGYYSAIPTHIHCGYGSSEYIRYNLWPSFTDKRQNLSEINWVA